MDTQQISLPSNSNTSSPRSVKKVIEVSESDTRCTVLLFSQKNIEGKSLLNINERDPLMNSRNSILYYLLDKKY
jgi:hypothetical protein